ncbi:SPOR domain-containing protein [Vibrio sp. JC009]|uniref:SPOR domain-containing protein n=1 Tax=Vibrio sp. JC009 TaxID=2912314 RepID=UPI0023B17B51|nr:SPOR domain-containing protein [Vibrio sp. JC009]WED24381.1 SPOR domain-containing protein [Vibrio sp. JC009]
MKKISIIGLSVLLAACSMGGGQYVTEVTSDSYREDYQPKVMAKPMPAEAVMTETVVQPAQQQQVVVQAQPMTQQNTVTLQPPQTQQIVQPVAQTKKVRIIAPQPKHKQMVQRFGYTLQVVAVGSSAKIHDFASMLPGSEPMWEHYKRVNGTEWFALLYGDYATKSEAKAAIMTLPESFRNLKPFVKSIDDIKNSNYPKLNQLR